MSTGSRSGERNYTRATKISPCPHCGKSTNRCFRVDGSTTSGCYSGGAGGGEAKTDAHGSPYWVYKDQGIFTPPPTDKAAGPRIDRAGDEALNEVYEALLGSLDLSPHHVAAMAARGFAAGHSRAIGYRSLARSNRADMLRILAAKFDEATLLAVPGFFLKEGRPSIACLDGLLLPARRSDGRVVALSIRPEAAISGGNKYMWVSSYKKNGPSPGSPCHTPLGCGGPAERVVVVEGLLKADLVHASTGWAVLACPGVNWQETLPALKASGVTTVAIAFDGDWRTNPNVAGALWAFAYCLRDQGYAVEVLVWDVELGKGLDDLLTAGHTPMVVAGGEVDSLLEEVEAVATAGGVSCRRPTDPPSGSGGGGPLPQILITTDEFAVNNRGIEALARDPEVFSRGGSLVTIRRDSRSTRTVERSADSPQIIAMTKPTIRERLAKNALWFRIKIDKKTDEAREVPAHPTDWTVGAVEARGCWPGIRVIEGIIEAPTLLADGSVLQEPGYHPESGLLYEPNGEFPLVPEVIGRADARAAAELLLEVVRDFPFAEIKTPEGDSEVSDGGLHHRAAWLASALTPFGRFAILGPCPLFLADANVRGAGKTKLIEIVSVAATNRSAARTSCPEGDEEMRKQILAIAIAGDPLILIDNAANGASFGWPSLDGVLTGTTVKGRILGRSEMTGAIPIYTLWYVTGNNLSLQGDMIRRVVPYRLESPEEQPEERQDFKVPGNLIDHVRANRGKLVVAVLTVLRGYVLAGRPKGNLVPMDYPEWCSVVREAIYWAIGVDPCRTRQELAKDDPLTNFAKALLEGWAELPEGQVGLSVGSALAILKKPGNEGSYTILREVFMEWSRNGELPASVVVGKRLKVLRDRVVGGLTLRGLKSGNNQIWRVAVATTRSTPSPASEGTEGTEEDPSAPCEKNNRYTNTHYATDKSKFSQDGGFQPPYPPYPPRDAGQAESVQANGCVNGDAGRGPAASEASPPSPPPAAGPPPARDRGRL